MKTFLQTVHLSNRVLKHRSGPEILALLTKAGRNTNPTEERTAFIFACLQNLLMKTLGYKAYDTQLLAGYYLQQARVVELKTGEGKTLASIFPMMANVLAGKICHIATVNDYLAQRDQEWARPLANLLQVTTGLIQSGSSLGHRTQAYNKDITYLNTSEVGFDQMRDTLCLNSLDQIQSRLEYILIDEIDSVLIDSARTPLLLSGQSVGGSDVAFTADEMACCLRLGEDFEVDTKQKNVYLTPPGLALLERLLGVRDLYETGPDGAPWISRILNSLRARIFYSQNIDYILHDQSIILLDQITGRALAGRRWSEGLHQAVEAKEGLPVQGEPSLIASTTYQNVFSAYQSVAGMSGTVAQAAEELDQIYGLKVALLPTTRPSMTTELPALIYQSELNKCRGIVTECRLVQLQYESPVLIATLDIERSELLSELFVYNDICHQLLNARPERSFAEAEIIAQAGRRNMVTVSTNMAGRGTDILLGGNPQACLKNLGRAFCTELSSVGPAAPPKFNLSQSCLSVGATGLGPRASSREFCLRKIWRLSKEALGSPSSQLSLNIPFLSLSCAERELVRVAGGLYVLSSEKSESSRVDQQLIGRTGRQGDPGTVRFILSLEDKLLKQVGLARFVQSSAPSSSVDPIANSAFYSLFGQAQTKAESLFANVRKQTFKDQTILNYYKFQMLSDRQSVVWDKLAAKWVLVVFSAAHQKAPSLEHIWLGDDSRRALTSIWYSNNLAGYLEKTLVLNLLDTSWRQFQELFLALKKGLVWKTWGRRDLLTSYIEASHQCLASNAKQYHQSLTSSLD